MKRRSKSWYRSYLKTSHWKRTRAAAMKRARYRCQICNSTKSLQVHHRTYERLGAELASDLITVCRTCHRKIHGLR